MHSPRPWELTALGLCPLTTAECTAAGGGDAHCQAGPCPPPSLRHQSLCPWHEGTLRERSGAPPLTSALMTTSITPAFPKQTQAAPGNTLGRCLPGPASAGPPPPAQPAASQASQRSVNGGPSRHRLLCSRPGCRPGGRLRSAPGCPPTAARPRQAPAPPGTPRTDLCVSVPRGAQGPGAPARFGQPRAPNSSGVRVGQRGRPCGAGRWAARTPWAWRSQRRR